MASPALTSQMLSELSRIINESVALMCSGPATDETGCRVDEATIERARTLNNNLALLTTVPSQNGFEPMWRAKDAHDETMLLMKIMNFAFGDLECRNNIRRVEPAAQKNTITSQEYMAFLPRSTLVPSQPGPWRTHLEIWDTQSSRGSPTSRFQRDHKKRKPSEEPKSNCDARAEKVVKSRSSVGREESSKSELG